MAPNPFANLHDPRQDEDAHIYDEWQRMGYQVLRYERHTGKNADGWYTITLKKLRHAGACEEAIQAVQRWKRKHHPRIPKDFEIPVTLEPVKYVASRSCGVVIWTAAKKRQTP